MNIRLHIAIVLTIFTIHYSFADNRKLSNKDKPLVQLSGFITNKSGLPISYADVKIKNTFRSTKAGADGFYTFVAKPGDTLIYTSIGYKTTDFILPLVINGDNKLLHSVIMPRDTYNLPPVIVSPWPSKEHFRYAFLNLKLDETPNERAVRNLSQEELAKVMEYLEMDGGEYGHVVLNQIAQSYYYSGGQRNYQAMGNGGVILPTSLTNPFAWAQFFKSIKEGKYKKKKTK
jgi:hypothetical protein